MAGFRADCPRTSARQGDKERKHLVLVMFRAHCYALAKLLARFLTASQGVMIDVDDVHAVAISLDLRNPM